jgi:hypothetical protein
MRSDDNLISVLALDDTVYFKDQKKSRIQPGGGELIRKREHIELQILPKTNISAGTKLSERIIEKDFDDEAQASWISVPVTDRRTGSHFLAAGCR